MRELTLSPRHLVEYLAPTLTLDGPVLEGWRLFDAYRLTPDEPVCVELRKGPSGRDVVRVELELDGDGPAQYRPIARFAGLRVGYRSASGGKDTAVGPRACKVVARALASSLGTGAVRWTVARPSLDTIAAAVEAEVSWQPAPWGAERDAALLGEDFVHYEALYGARPEVRVVSVLGEACPGVSVHYPAPANGRLPPSAAIYASSLRVAHRRRMRRYFGRLGVVFNRAAEPRTVPTPTTYARCLRDRPGLARVRPRMIAGVSGSMRPIHWGVLVRRHLLPVTVAPAWAVALHRQLRDIEPLAGIPCDVGMLAHDMGLHALGVHAIPEQAWDELAAAAAARARARLASLALGPWGVLARLAAFFEGPVTSRCWDVWRDVAEPEDFGQAFEAQLGELLAELRQL